MHVEMQFNRGFAKSLTLELPNVYFTKIATVPPYTREPKQNELQKHYYYFS